MLFNIPPPSRGGGIMHWWPLAVCLSVCLFRSVHDPKSRMEGHRKLYLGQWPWPVAFRPKNCTPTHVYKEHLHQLPTTLFLRLPARTEKTDEVEYATEPLCIPRWQHYNQCLLTLTVNIDQTFAATVRLLLTLHDVTLCDILANSILSALSRLRADIICTPAKNVIYDKAAGNY